MKKIKEIIRKFLTPYKLHIKEMSTIPTSLNMEQEKFSKLITLLIEYLDLHTVTSSLDIFLNSTAFKELNIALNNGNNLFLIGYAFALAIEFKKEQMEKEKQINIMLSMFSQGKKKSLC